MLILTRDALLSAAGLKPVRDLKRSIRAIRQAHQAERKGEPDHVVRLRAAELMTGLLGVKDAPPAGPDSSRPVNVNIVLASSPGALSSKPGLVLTLPLATPQVVAGPVDNTQLAFPDAVGQA